jgi:hypothetical protein
MAVFALVIAGERREAYQLMVIRHPWIRLVSILWIVACGGVVAYFAHEQAGWARHGPQVKRRRWLLRLDPFDEPAPLPHFDSMGGPALLPR